MRLLLGAKNKLALTSQHAHTHSTHCGLRVCVYIYTRVSMRVLYNYYYTRALRVLSDIHTQYIRQAGCSILRYIGWSECGRRDSLPACSATLRAARAQHTHFSIRTHSYTHIHTYSKHRRYKQCTA